MEEINEMQFADKQLRNLRMLPPYKTIQDVFFPRKLTYFDISILQLMKNNITKA
jgi:hypothetical protein